MAKKSGGCLGWLKFLWQLWKNNEGRRIMHVHIQIWIDAFNKLRDKVLASD